MLSILLMTALLSSMLLTGCSKGSSTEESEAPAMANEKIDYADVMDVASQASSDADASDPDASDPALFSFEENQDGTLTLTGYTGSEVDVKIPSAINGKNVTAIGESCFAGNIFLEKVHVPEGVTVLGDYAFECCSVLKKVYLPDSLTAIGQGAFSGCCSLYLLDIQDNVTSIGAGAFLECTSLIFFVAPAALTNLGEFAFANCQNLVAVDLRTSSLEEVPARLFYDCINLSTIRLPESVASVGKRAFFHNDKLTYLYLPSSVQSVAAYAFERCGSLMNCDIPCSKVEPYTFFCCSSLSYVNFSEDLTEIGEGAFRNTSIVMEDLYIPEGAKVAADAFDHPEEIVGDPLYESGDWTGAENDTADTAAEAQTPDITVEELEAKAREDGYLTVSADVFDAWAQDYLALNADNALLDGDLNPYITKYKGEIGYYYKAMTAVASGVEDEIEEAKVNFGDDFEAMYTMINHGLATEMSRFRVKDDMLLYTGVYEFQLQTAAGTDHVPTLDELKALVGTTFTDNCLTSTTTEAKVAFGFGDTLFVIYAPAENLNALGCVCMDSYMHTFENEILLCSGATYEVLDVGVMEGVLEDYDGTEHTECRNFVLLQLINQ